jgi:soluble lytic murein transglycosylase-like protein
MLAAILFLSSPAAYSQFRIERAAFERLDVFQRASFFEKHIATIAAEHCVDPKLLWTIAYLETRFRPWLTSPKGAKGLMQFMPATAARFALSDPYQPIASLHAAARYVRFLSRMFDGKNASILAAYNAGEGTVSAFLTGRSLLTDGKMINPFLKQTVDGVPPYRETRNYVREGVRVYTWLNAAGKFESRSVRDAKAIAPTTESTRISDSPEVVFYEPRSGNRYSASDSGRKRSKAAGVVVISPNASVKVQNSARTTYFSKEINSSTNPLLTRP